MIPSNLGVEVAVADEKTRILTPAEQQKLRLLRPKASGDKIVFFCSNGHRIVAPLENAGLAGACSRCNVPVKVPAAPSPVPPATGAAPEAADGTRIVRSDAEVKVSAPAGPPPVAPSPPPGGETAAAETAADMPDQADEAAADWNFLGGAEAAGAEADVGDEARPAPPGEDGFASDSDNPTAVLLGRLWEEQQHGGLVQVHLKDGGLILPQEFAPRWSQGTHALFASSEADGTITLTAVAWDAIQKIVVRNLKDGLPPGMFD
jgi:hypothetical protein